MAPPPGRPSVTPADRVRVGLASLGRTAAPTWPYALVLAAALAGALWIGANLSNATPSSSRPYGWPGTADFDAAVASMRPALVLAASVPGLLMGLAAARRPPARRAPRQSLPPIMLDLALLALGAYVGAHVGALGARRAAGAAVTLFVTAHLLLAWVAYAMAQLASSVSRRHGAALAAGLWMADVGLSDSFVRWHLFRDAGYTNLAAGRFPGWFYASQAASPTAAYRGMLILGRPGFRDYTEHAALDGATMPAWLTPALFVWVLVLLWVALPLAYAQGISWVRRLRSDAGGWFPGRAAPTASLTAAAVPDDEA